MSVSWINNKFLVNLIPYKRKLTNSIAILLFYTSEVSIFSDGHIFAFTQ